MLRLFVVIVLVLLSTTSFAQDDQEDSNSEPIDLIFSPIDALHYNTELTWKPETDQIEGQTTLTIKALESLDSFALYILALDILSVTVNEQEAAFEHPNPFQFVVTPQEALAADETFTVVVIYSGKPSVIPDSALMYPDYGWVHGDDGITVLARGQGAWQPISYGDMATMTLGFTVPQPYVAVSGGQLVGETTESENTRFAWSLSQPMYEVPLFIGDYVRDTIDLTSGIPMLTFTPQDWVDRAANIYRLVDETLILFVDAFGPYPFESLNAVFIPENGSSASAFPATMAFGRSVGEDVVAREIAHQWFGISTNPVSMGDNWLSEGAGRYADWLYVLRNAYFKDVSSLDKAFPNALNVFYQRVAPMHSPGNPTSWSASEVHERGAYVFLALQARVGSATFFDILRAYQERYRFADITCTDFITVAEEISGEDLTSFFDLLLYSEKLPPPSVYSLP